MLDIAIARNLPAVPGLGFALGQAEPLSVGIQRAAVEQFDRSISGLTSDQDIDRAVHEARKSMKRLRSVLRLVRGEVGNRIYLAENALLRDTARRLAPMRDGWVMVRAVQGLREDFSSQLSDDAFAELEDSLIERHERRRKALLEGGETFPHVVAVLRAARARYAAWPSAGDRISIDVYGRRPLRDTFDAIEPGLGSTYRRGRSEMERAIATRAPGDFHQWRKRIKYLRHQVELLEPLWPEVMKGYATSLDGLGELLGEEHDLTVLLASVAGNPSMTSSFEERMLVSALAQHRRRLLQEAAITRGTRAYAETADRFLDRIGQYWKARAAEIGTG